MSPPRSAVMKLKGPSDRVGGIVTLFYLYLAGAAATCVAFLAYAWRDFHPSDIPTSLFLAVLWPLVLVAAVLAWFGRVTR